MATNTHIQGDHTLCNEGRFFRFLGSVRSEPLFSDFGGLSIFLFVIRAEEIDVIIVIIISGSRGSSSTTSVSCHSLFLAWEAVTNMQRIDYSM